LRAFFIFIICLQFAHKIEGFSKLKLGECQPFFTIFYKKNTKIECNL